MGSLCALIALWLFLLSAQSWEAEGGFHLRPALSVSQLAAASERVWRATHLLLLGLTHPSQPLLASCGGSGDEGNETQTSREPRRSHRHCSVATRWAHLNFFSSPTPSPTPSTSSSSSFFSFSLSLPFPSTAHLAFCLDLLNFLNWKNDFSISEKLSAFNTKC